MIDIQELELEFNAFYGDEENEHTLLARMFPLIAEVKRLREESKKKGAVLTALDEMIRNNASHVEMMKALERGLDLPETWKEMVE
tara:strand:- start:1489 stop:1743 length:255 start_codon:yes stop_codon:yes gene_type:complete